MNLELIANRIDILNRRIAAARITIRTGRIAAIDELGDSIDDSLPFVLPGFIDAHIHIESSMLVPSEFARLATLHGTVAVVSDPHEIANVMGVPGIDFMIENADRVPLKCYFGAPSCVPATQFESSGARIDATAVRQLLKRQDIHYLAEMMNFPGVLSGDEEVLSKIAAAKELGKPIDGHAPGLTGEQARGYCAAGISTDHECTCIEEAAHKLSLGMKILIREGSAAKNFDALHPLIRQAPGQLMFCSDDKHPNDLAIGHINQVVAEAIKRGHDLYDVLQIACLNPIAHYDLDVGQLRVADPADMIVVNDLKSWTVQSTMIQGQWVAKDSEPLIPSVPVAPVNQFACRKHASADFCYDESDKRQVDVIIANDGSLVTDRAEVTLESIDGALQPNVTKDILKIAVVNRYQHNEPSVQPALAWIQGFGFRTGAIASCVAHDSHNIVAVGVSDQAISAAVNLVIDQKGGIAAVSGHESKSLPLGVGGIMSDEDAFQVAQQYEDIEAFAKSVLGSQLTSPFMTLSFMALLVIPKLKLSDRGLFDAESFQFVRS